MGVLGWLPRRVGGAVPVQRLAGSRTMYQFEGRKKTDVSAWRWPSPAGGVLSYSVEGQPFVLFRPIMGWMRPTYNREANLFYSVYQLKWYSHPNTLTQKHSEECLTKYLGTPWPSQDT